MKTFVVILILAAVVFCLSFTIRHKKEYKNLYSTTLDAFKQEQNELYRIIQNADLSKKEDRNKIKQQIHSCRLKLKSIDFWLRYLEPIAYRRINGPLPVEWETEVFEKFEPPYRRDGGGLILSELALEDVPNDKGVILSLIDTSLVGIRTFEADSITTQLNSFHHFFLANRLYLLNLAALYTTGFECPDTNNIIPELQSMLPGIKNIYTNFNSEFSSTPLTGAYLDQYDKTIDFVNGQPKQFSLFDHFTFIRDYVNPLFAMNQQFINSYGVVSSNFNDYSLDNSVSSIFDKSLYNSQNTKGIFSFVDDVKVLAEIRRIGKLLFYDPILSGNNKRSCASCHKPTEYFTDTSTATSPHFDQQQHLPRNTPTLVNSVFNHLIMYDGKHISLQAQAKDVMTNPDEMNGNEKDIVKKVMSCKEYKDAFKKFLKYTPEEKDVSLSHIVSSLTLYYAGFSQYYSPFDETMNSKTVISPEVKEGFNIFMSKAQCGTCHFVPHFNGIKPPYISSEFEVLGVPADTGFIKLSADKGRFDVNPAAEMMNAFRTGTIRNSSYTKPYMHNGVFKSLEEVIDFYDAGGGAGKKLPVANQTLASDSLKLTRNEKANLITFIQSLNENIIFETPPAALPASTNKVINNRKVGGEY